MSEAAIVPHRPDPPLLARNAGDLLWLARYVERVENLARILDVTQVFARDERDGGHWRAVMRINGDEARFLDGGGTMAMRAASRASTSSTAATRPPSPRRWRRRGRMPRTLRAIIRPRCGCSSTSSTPPSCTGRGGRGAREPEPRLRLPQGWLPGA
jgi:hypothetical protein